MPDNADSILEAAKKTAVALQLPWPEVQKVYRALQEDNPSTHSAWLPKSAGRRIWHAHPNYIVRLITALGFQSSDLSEAEANYLAHGLCSKGSPFAIEYPASGIPAPFETYFSAFLLDAQRANDLIAIEFAPVEKRISFILRDERVDFAPSDHDGFTRYDDDLHSQAVLASLRKNLNTPVSQITIVQGAAIQELAEAVCWRDVQAGAPPFFHTDELAD